MAERILSIEIGHSLTKVCEIEKASKSPKIFNSFIIPTPDNMVREDSTLEINEKFAQDFQRILNSKNIKTKKAVFTVVSNKIATREATIPYVKDKQIMSVIRANLSDYFPVELSKYLFSYTVLEVLREGDTAEKPKSSNKPTGIKILLLAIPRPIMQSYERLSKALGLELVTIDYNGNSIYQAAKEECKKGIQLIIKVDEKNTLLMVLKDGVIDLTRTIPYGIDEAVSILQNTKELGDVSTYEKALELARRKTVISASFNNESVMVNLEPGSKSDEVKSERRAVTEGLRALVGGIIRVIEYYNSNHGDNPIEKIYLTGIGADFSGLSGLLTRESGVDIKNLTHLAGIDIEKIFKDVTYGEYVACIGAGIAPLSFFPDKQEDKKGGGGLKTDSFYVAIVFFVVGIGASIVMVVMSVIPYLKESKLNEEYNATIENYAPQYEIYLQYKAVNKQVEELRALERATETPNSNLQTFIGRLESGMPSSFSINTLSVQSDRLFFDATVGDKSDVAYVLSVLKGYEEFLSADLTSVSQTETELGETSYSFSVEMVYAPVSTDEEEVE